MAKKRDRAEKVRQPGPMDQQVMICRDCGGQETEAIYQVVWRSKDHPENESGKEQFFMNLWKYKCKGCGCEDYVLPPLFQLMRMQMKAKKNPMKLVKPDSPVVVGAVTDAEGAEDKAKETPGQETENLSGQEEGEPAL
ncbi:MAG: hypothetical protein ABSH41_26175 [Syntrophobacteraceae bacterium]